MSDLKYKTPGPWDDEPDADDFEACGLKCAMRRDSILGHWCGYVLVPKDHAFFGKDKFWASDLHVHGGITFSGGLKDYRGLWAFGFDCARLYDLRPGRNYENRDPTKMYRDYSYVRAECDYLAAQLAAFGDLADRLDDLMEQNQ